LTLIDVAGHEYRAGYAPILPAGAAGGTDFEQDSPSIDGA